MVFLCVKQIFLRVAHILGNEMWKKVKINIIRKICHERAVKNQIFVSLKFIRFSFPFNSYKEIIIIKLKCKFLHQQINVLIHFETV